jgi:hypothetical protein
MRMTVTELIKELEKCEGSSHVQFQTGIGNSGPAYTNGVARVDRFVGRVAIVIQSEA